MARLLRCKTQYLVTGCSEYSRRWGFRLLLSGMWRRVLWCLLPVCCLSTREGRVFSLVNKADKLLTRANNPLILLNRHVTLSTLCCSHCRLFGAPGLPEHEGDGVTSISCRGFVIVRDFRLSRWMLLHFGYEAVYFWQMGTILRKSLLLNLEEVSSNQKQQVPPKRPYMYTKPRGEQCGSETGLALSTLVFPCPYHSTSAP